MAVQLYVDDSGAKGQPSPAVLAGLLHTAEDWMDFSAAWKAVLDDEPRVWRFKMAEAASLDGPFYALSHAQRDEKLRRLASVVRRFRPTVFFASVDLDGFRVSIEPWETPPVNQPYFHLFFAMVWRVAYQLAICHQVEPFEAIFDRQVMHEEGVKTWYPVYRDFIERAGRAEGPHSIWVAAGALMPPQPQFRSDDDLMPLQCADMYAYMLRCERLGDNDRFKWLRELLPPVNSAADLSMDYWRTLITGPRAPLVARLSDPDRYADLLKLGNGPGDVSRLLQERARQVVASRTRTSQTPQPSRTPGQPEGTA